MTQGGPGPPEQRGEGKAGCPQHEEPSKTQESPALPGDNRVIQVGGDLLPQGGSATGLDHVALAGWVSNSSKAGDGAPSPPHSFPPRWLCVCPELPVVITTPPPPAHLVLNQTGASCPSLQHRHLCATSCPTNCQATQATVI